MKETIGSCELAFTDKDPAELAWELHRDKVMGQKLVIHY